MPKVRVKICGITRLEDARAAVTAGADALGFVFHASSPRAVTAERARGIVAELPPFVTVVGVFVDPPASLVEAVLSEVNLEVLQFHGDERPAACERFGRRYIKTVRMAPGVDVRAVACEHRSAQALLLDTQVADAAGGTGKTFDWALVPAGLEKPVVLAGGLTPENVREAIRRVRPWAVDVSTAVEGPHKGIKDAGAIERFMGAVRDV